MRSHSLCNYNIYTGFETIGTDHYSNISYFKLTGLHEAIGNVHCTNIGFDINGHVNKSKCALNKNEYNRNVTNYGLILISI